MPNSDDVLIKVENVSKKFCRSLKRSMLYGIDRDRCALLSLSASYALKYLRVVDDTLVLLPQNALAYMEKWYEN